MVFTPAVGDPVPDFRRFCLQHRDELLRLVSSCRVPTNEARRCCYLLPAVMLVGQLAGRPLALIEPGASAGLNLAMDAYAYDYGAWVKVGDTGSQLLRCRLHGPLQPPLHLPVPQVAWRAGIDINPLDPTDPQDAAWLRALVWPDHRDRVPRLNAALRIASCRPAVQMFAGDALRHLPAAVDAAPAEAAVCIFHTAFLATFPRPIAIGSTARSLPCLGAAPSTGSRPNPAATRPSRGYGLPSATLAESAGNGRSGTTSPTVPGWNGLPPTSRPAPDLL